ncbi:MAG: hypothetical protein MI861_22880, partial [Pirellulales bacterium]|nr:hypothetical protein [Pirellulales bacterium]
MSDQHWVLASDQFDRPMQVPRQRVRAFIVMQRDPIPADPGRSGRSGRLELGGGHKLTGRLVPAIEQAAADVSCFRWQPFGSLNSSSLRLGAGGRIVYRDPPPQRSTVTPRINPRHVPAQRLRVQQQKRGLNFGELFLQKVDRRPAAKPVSLDAHKLHARSGDVIPCLVNMIDEQGVHIDTSAAEDIFVPHAKIKAVELVSNVSPPDLKEAKKKRLLTLPRLQKSSPPTHLLCSRNGDFLRCRLLGVSDTTVRVELQLEEVEIPLDRVAQIIWFHPEELLSQQQGQDEETPEPVASPFVRLAQVLKRDGKRVTFDPQRVDDGKVYGTSEVVGE